MSTEETTSLGPLYAALAKAQGAIRGAEKDRTNPQFRQGYATLASVWDACRAALSANGLCVVQALDVGHEGHVCLRTTLGHASGGSITSEYPVRPTQDTPQAYGSALTYARRYCLASMVGVAPEDDDGEAASKAPPRPDVPALAARLSSAATSEALKVAEENVRTVWGALSDKERKDLQTYRDAARERLTPKPAPIAEPPEQAAKRAELAAALREPLPEDEPPSDAALAEAILVPLLAASPKDEAALTALWATALTSPAYRSATEGARAMAAETVEGIRDAMRAETPKTRKGGR